MPGSGGTYSAQYCYSVWLRHLAELKKAHLIKNIWELNSIAEIGPGDSLGIGIAGLFSGINEYYGFDVIKHANKEGNIKIANDIYKLFLEKQDIPNGNKFSNIHPEIENYKFPEDILGIEINNISYLKERLKEITNALKDKSSGVTIHYVVPWDSSSSMYAEKIDLIYSQAVMEHVEDIESAYGAMFKWLKPGGILSHQIDFKTHEMTTQWNGHWFISESIWKLLLHGRKYSLNRLPVSAHINAIQKAGFTIKNILPVYMMDKFEGKPTKLKRYIFSKEDYQISSVLIQALK